MKATSTILEKVVITQKKIDIKKFQTVSFLTLIIVMLPVIYFFWRLDTEALRLTNILIFILIIIFSFLGNIFLYYSLKHEKITQIEPARILEPLLVILIAIIFSFFINSSLYERKISVILPAIIAATTLLFSHIKKHHLKFNKYFITTLIASTFFALELVISRLLLDFYSPMTFYFIRALAVSILSLLIFMPNFKGLDKKSLGIILLTSIGWVIYRVLIYYGYIHYGVIFTTLLFLLAPIFIYLFAHIFLKEKISWKNIVTSLIILACVAYAILI